MTEAKKKVKPGLRNWGAADRTPVAIDFIAYLPLDECVSRLEKLDKNGWWRSIKTYVAITPIDDISCAFQVKRETSVLRLVEANGYLQNGEGDFTLVKGEVISHAIPHPIRLFVSFLILQGIIIVFPKYLPFLGGVVIQETVDVFTRFRRRHKLAEVIERALGY